MDTNSDLFSNFIQRLRRRDGVDIFLGIYAIPCLAAIITILVVVLPVLVQTLGVTVAGFSGAVLGAMGLCALWIIYSTFFRD